MEARPSPWARRNGGPGLRARDVQHVEPGTPRSEVAVRYPGRVVRHQGLRPAPRSERTRGRLERGGRRTPMPPDPGRRGPPRGPERDGGPLDAPGRAGRVPQTRTPGRGPAPFSGTAEVIPRWP